MKLTPPIRLQKIQRSDGDDAAAGLKHPSPLGEGGERIGNAVQEEGIQNDIERGVREGKGLCAGEGKAEVGELVGLQGGRAPAGADEVGGRGFTTDPDVISLADHLVAQVDAVDVPGRAGQGDFAGEATDGAAEVGNGQGSVGVRQPGADVVEEGLKRIAAVEVIAEVQGRLPGDEGVVALVDVGAGFGFRFGVVERDTAAEGNRFR